MNNVVRLTAERIERARMTRPLRREIIPAVSLEDRVRKTRHAALMLAFAMSKAKPIRRRARNG